MLASARARNAFVREGHLTLFRRAFVQTKPQLRCACRPCHASCVRHTLTNTHKNTTRPTAPRYLPLTMEAAFMGHLSEVLPAILDGLSDEAEGVRDAALAAARAFVEIYARRWGHASCRVT